MTGAASATTWPTEVAELASQRHLAVQEFLRARGLDPTWLEEFLLDQVGDGELLLTSSPVHGLANSTSDLDFIRIQEDEPGVGPRISTKIFERGHHLEVVSFSADELARNLGELSTLSVQSPAEMVAGFRSWDRRLEPRRKQTERIINGLTLTGAAPYLRHLPALSTVWSTAALHAAIEQAVQLSLSEAARELRGRFGYAYNVLLHLMDAVLSAHADVYTTRKWYLLRWTRFIGSARGSERYAGLTERIEDARRSVSAGLISGDSGPIAAGYHELVAEAARLLTGCQELTVRIALDPSARVQPLLPGSSLLLGLGRSVAVIGELTGGDSLRTLAELAALPTPLATNLLHALRAGLATIEINYVDEVTS